MKEPAVIDAAHLTHQREFSLKTFGPGARTAGVIDHIEKELIEIADDPDDISEWADLVILAFDGALRAGHEPQEIIDAIKTKQARNETRTWPDWRTQDPNKAIEHVRDEAEESAKQAADDRAELTEDAEDPATSGSAEECSNCDGRKCMSCVCREYHDACADDCPFCCPTAEIKALTADQVRDAVLDELGYIGMHTVVPADNIVAKLFETEGEGRG